MATLFNKGDQAYFLWMQENPSGFILNTGKGKGSRDFILHQSNCLHITKSENFDDEAYTMRDWVKVAAHDVDEIIAYCQTEKSEFTGQFKLCKTCEPNYENGDFENREINYPDELPEDKAVYIEGMKKVVIVNAFERKDKARTKCIEHYGYACQCCGLILAEQYGEIGKSFIHVHHIRPLSQIGQAYQVDPINDLIPLCPNCHAMIHRKNPPYSVGELKEILRNHA